MFKTRSISSQIQTEIELTLFIYLAPLLKCLFITPTVITHTKQGGQAKQSFGQLDQLGHTVLNIQGENQFFEMASDSRKIYITVDLLGIGSRELRSLKIFFCTSWFNLRKY